MMSINHSRPIRRLPVGLLVLLLLILQLQAPLGWAQLSSNSSGPAPEYGPSSNRHRLNPGMAFIIAFFVCCFFFMCFFSIYVRQCADQPPIGPTGLLPGPTGPSGLDRGLIDTFPTVEYSFVKRLSLVKAVLECAVCLNEFEDQEVLRVIPRCCHVFHPECIDAWLSSHTTCPLCRSNLADPNPESPDPCCLCDLRTHSAREGQNPKAEQPLHTSIPMEDGPIATDGVNPAQTPLTPRLSRSSKRSRRFPRSHSTGHSLGKVGDRLDRFTLRLPDDVMKEIMNGSLQRTSSWVPFPRNDGPVSGGSSRGRSGYRNGGEGSSLGGRTYEDGSSRGWFDRLARSKTVPVESPEKVDGEQTGSSRGRFPSDNAV